MAVQISGNDITVPRDTTVTRNLTVGGVLTYEDVTNVDSVGLITARSGIKVTSGDIAMDTAGNITLGDSGGSTDDRLTFGASADLSIYHDGTHSYVVNTVGNLRFQNNGTVKTAQFEVDTIDFNDSGNSTVHMRKDSSGRLLLGHISSRTVGDRTHLLQIEGTELQDGGLSMVRNRNDEHSTSITLAKTRGSSTGANTIVQSGDSIGEFAFAAGDGTDVVTRAGRIHCEIDGTPGANDMPGRLILSTTADGAASPTERVRIDSSGRVLIGSTTADDAAQMLKVARTSGTSRLAIQAANDGSSQLDFADVADADIGRIQYDHNSNYMALFTNNSEALRIESNGNVVLNHTDSITYNGHDPKLSIQGTTYSESTLAIISNTNQNNGAYIFLGKQRSGSAGGGTVVQDGDLIGQFRYLAGDGTDLQSEVANITVYIDGTPGGNDVPGRISFATTNDGGNASTERMRIRQNGEVVFGAGINPGVTEPFLVELGGTIRRRYSSTAGSGMHLTGGAIFPTTGTGVHTNGGTNWGTSSYRWGQIYSTSSTISTSDRTLKNTITTSDLGLDFINQLKPVSYKFNDGTSGRIHYGLISQDVEDILTNIGKTGADFAGFCKDKNSRIETNADGSDSVIEEDGENYSLRYEEFIAPLIKAVQELSAENTALKARLDAAGL